MRVLDLFTGLGGWSTPFRERGHDVCSVDIEPRFGATIRADILGLRAGELPWRPDIVLASPPCEAFSVLTIGRSWIAGLPPTPRSDKARLALELVAATRRLIGELSPAYYVIENPRAMLRKLPALADLERRTVTYCQYGGPTMKPTDLWGGFPPSLELRPPCRSGDPCHLAAPRGSTTGTQGFGLRRPGIDGHGSPDRAGRLRDSKRRTRTELGTSDPANLAALRAVIPHALALEVCLAAEQDLAAGAASVPYQPQLWEPA